MERRVVIIEDERDVARLLEFNLRSAGFEVTTAATGGEGLAAVRANPPDVIILDLMLPDQSGYEVCKAVRADTAISDTGVLMLTAKGEAEDRILGLEVGADDYVVKPFVVREVVLRVTAIANRLAERRARPSSGDPSGVLKVGPIELDPVTHDVRINGAPTQLRPLEYKLLQLLVCGSGTRVLSRGAARAGVGDARGYQHANGRCSRSPAPREPRDRCRCRRDSPRVRVQGEARRRVGVRAELASQPALFTFLVLVIVVGAGTLFAIERTLADDLVSALDTRMTKQGEEVAAWLESAGHPDRLAPRLAKVTGTRITIIGEDGLIQGDSLEPSTIGRPIGDAYEVAKARRGESGRAIRQLSPDGPPQYLVAVPGRTPAA